MTDDDRQAIARAFGIPAELAPIAMRDAGVRRAIEKAVARAQQTPKKRGPQAAWTPAKKRQVARQFESFARNRVGTRSGLFAERAKQMGLTHLTVDEIAGVQTGYFGKICCGTRHFGDVSLGSILGALGCQLALIQAAGSYREAADEAAASIERLAARRKEIAQKGGRARWRNVSAEKRSAAAKRAVEKRWSDWRAAKARKAKRQQAAHPTCECGALPAETQ